VESHALGAAQRAGSTRHCGKRIPFYNTCYDKGAEQKLFETLSEHIQEITAIFRSVPDFLDDRWIDEMLERRSGMKLDSAYDHFGSTAEPIRRKGNHGVSGCRLGSNRRCSQQERLAEGTAWELVKTVAVESQRPPGTSYRIGQRLGVV
jgi:hypothetical protein